MQSWLADNFDLLIMLLGIAALALAYVWWRTRQRAYAWGAGVAAGLIGLVCLLGYLLPFILGESDSQQIERKVRAMAAAVKAGDLEQAFRHLSQEFRFRGLDRAAFRRKAEEAIRRHEIEDVAVWDFEHGEIARQKRSARVSFLVKVRGNWPGSEASARRCDADFVLDRDGQWRLKSFHISGLAQEDPFSAKRYEPKTAGAGPGVRPAAFKRGAGNVAEHQIGLQAEAVMQAIKLRPRLGLAGADPRACRGSTHSLLILPLPGRSLGSGQVLALDRCLSSEPFLVAALVTTPKNALDVQDWIGYKEGLICEHKG